MGPGGRGEGRPEEHGAGEAVDGSRPVRYHERPLPFVKWRGTVRGSRFRRGVENEAFETGGRPCMVPEKAGACLSERMEEMSERKRLDAGSPCPGGLGQTVRECGCSKLVSRIADIERAWEGNQRRAALDQIELLIRKEGIRACTASMKVRFLEAMGEIDEAIDTMQVLIETAPQHPAALATLAELLAEKGDERAIEVAVDAAELYENQEASFQPFLNAALRIGEWFAQEKNDLMAAATWMRICLPYMTDDSRQSLADLLAGAPESKVMAVFSEFPMPPSRDGEGKDLTERVPSFRDAIHAAMNGRFRAAISQLERVWEQYPHELVLGQELARCLAAIGDSAAVSRTLRKLAAHDSLSPAWKLWIDSVVQWYDVVVCGDPEYKQNLTWKVDDANAAMELLHSHAQSLVLPGTPPGIRDLKPPPKGLFLMLSQEPLTTLNQQELDQVGPERVPYLYGLLLLFGKQTDQPARIEVISDFVDAQQTRELVESILGDHLSDFEQSDAVRTIPHCFRAEVQWQLVGASLEQTPDLAKQCDAYWVREVWPDMPHPGLGGKTPREAKGDSSLANQLAAAVFHIEVYLSTLGKEVDLTPLRQDLGVPEIETADPWETPVETLPLTQWTRLDMVKLGHDDAMFLLQRALTFRYVAAARQLADHLRETLGQDQLELQSRILFGLAEAEFDPRMAAQELEKAARIVDSLGKDSFIHWYLAVEKTLESGDFQNIQPRVSAALKAVDGRPEYMHGLMRLLMDHGLMQPSQLQAAAADTAAPATTAAAPAEGGLWTPDSPQPTAGAPGEEKKESKLWLPGMD